MKILGLTISRHTNALEAVPSVPMSVDPSRGWLPLIREWFTGAWQRNMEVRVENVLTYGIVFACITLIASDIAKLWLALMEKDANGIWTETDSSAFSPVLKRPNHYQNRIEFIQQWLFSKLIHGNTYVLKERDRRGVVIGLYLLDPNRVKPLIADDGSVFYQLAHDSLSGLEPDGVVVPAREIIHDIMYSFYHPLVGISPISACGLAAMQGLKIQNNSANLFANGSKLSGVLTAPGIIGPETAKRLEEHWNTNYAGEAGAGKVAVLGDGLKFEPMTMTAVDAQLIDQLKWTGENVCACFHVPGWKVGVAPMPAYGNVQAANIDYYSQALQILIEKLELCLDEGLELGNGDRTLGVQFDVDALLRMDTITATEAVAKGIGAGFLTPNEARAKFDYKPVAGGDTPYMQEQNWPLRLLSARELPTRPPTAPTPLPNSPEPQKQITGAVDEDPIIDGELIEDADAVMRAYLGLEEATL